MYVRGRERDIFLVQHLLIEHQYLPRDLTIMMVLFSLGDIVIGFLNKKEWISDIAFMFEGNGFLFIFEWDTSTASPTKKQFIE